MRVKKVLSILFALALVLSSLPASAIAESIEAQVNTLLLSRTLTY